MGKLEKKHSASWSSYTHRVRWFNFTMLILVPFAGFVQAIWIPLSFQTLTWSIMYYFITAGSITAGYHRLWAHRSYSASPVLKFLLAIFGAGAIQGSIKWWAKSHRVHHRFTDTELDPYNIKKGFLHAHILWILLKEEPRTNRTRPKKQSVSISDLTNDPIVAWQHSQYFFLAFFMGWAFPALVAGFGWNDWYGGFIYCGILRTFFVNQATFCVNSLAHYLGDQPYDDLRTPRDHFITALITLGEGYHNFHHEFPSDYRNGIEWHQIDVTKWSIWIWSYVGLAYDLKRFRQNEIKKGRVRMERKRLNEKEKGLDWGTATDQLPIMTWKEYRDKVKDSGALLVVVEGIVHDLSGFSGEHPGGGNIITSVAGKDATALFNGGLYNHSSAARSLLATMRVAVVQAVESRN